MELPYGRRRSAGAHRDAGAGAALGQPHDSEEGRRDSVAPGAAAQAAHRVSRTVERNTERFATGATGRTRARRNARGSRRRIAARADFDDAAAARTQTASGSPASPGKTATRRRGDRLRAELQALRWRNDGTPGGETVFDFQLGRGRDGPAKFLKDWNGILQTDGYQAYDQVGGPGLIHVGCWAHARRKFVDAVKVNAKDGAAIAMVTRTDALFLVDRHARQQQASTEERAAMSREQAQTWVDEIHSECRKLRAYPEKRVGRGRELHLKYVGQAAALLRSCRSRAVQQCRGELQDRKSVV